MQDSNYINEHIDSATESLKIAPQSIEAEQAVIGGLMLDNRAWDKVADLVIEDDFYRHDHRLIFRAVSSLAEKSQPFDVVTISEWLDSNDSLEQAGGLSYIGTLAKNTPSTANIVSYTQIVRERSILRQLISVGNEIGQSCYETEGRTSEQLLDSAEKLVFEIAEKGARVRRDFVPIKELLVKAVDRIDTLFQQDNPITGVETGFTLFDEMTSGLQSSDLVIVAGRPSMGKCIVAGSRILDPLSGELVEIEKIVRAKSASLLTVDENLKIQCTSPSDYVDDGIKPVFTLVTALGRVITTTITHPFLTRSGWKPLAEICIGQQVALPKALPYFGNHCLAKSQIKRLAYISSLHISKLHLRNRGAQFGKKILHTGRLVCLKIGNFPGSSMGFYNNFVKSIGYDHAWVSDVHAFISQAQPLKETRMNKLPGGKTSVSCLPNTVFTLPKQQLAFYLKTLFSICGRVTPSISSLKQNISLSCNIGRQAREIQHLLLRFGLIARVEYYDLNAVDDGNACLFVDKHAFDEMIKPESKCAFARNFVAGDINNKTIEGAFSGDHSHNRDKDIIWDGVVSIQFTGNKQVYDLTIPETHNFIAEDTLVHNTTFAINIAEHAAIKAEVPVAIFTMEMPGEQIAMRLLSSLGRIDQHKVRTGKLDDDDWPRLTSAVGLLAEAKMFIDDTPALTPNELRAKARRIAREHGLGLIVIDYLQLMQTSGSSENRTNEISEISRSLKALAKELNVPVIALSQLNRSLEQRPNKRPVMSDLRESGAIEQDADIITFIYRDEVYNEDSPDKGTAEIIIGKQRNGPIGTLRLTFLGQYTRFENFMGNVYSDEGFS